MYGNRERQSQRVLLLMARVLFSVSRWGPGSLARYYGIYCEHLVLEVHVQGSNVSMQFDELAESHRRKEPHYRYKPIDSGLSNPTTKENHRVLRDDT